MLSSSSSFVGEFVLLSLPWLESVLQYPPCSHLSSVPFILWRFPSSLSLSLVLLNSYIRFFPIYWPFRHLTLFLLVVVPSPMNSLLTCMVIFHLDLVIINNCVSTSDQYLLFFYFIATKLLLDFYHSVWLFLPHLPDLQVLYCLRVQCPLFYLHSLTLWHIPISPFSFKVTQGSTER